MPRRTVTRIALLILVVPLLVLGALRLVESDRAPGEVRSDPGARAANAAAPEAAPALVVDVGEQSAPDARDAATREAVPAPAEESLLPTDRRGLFVVPEGTPADESFTLVAGFPWTYDPPRTIEPTADGTFLLRDVPEGPVTFTLTARYLRLRGELASEEEGVLVLRPELYARLTGRVTTAFELAAGSVPEVWVGRLPSTVHEWTSWKRFGTAREPDWIAQGLAPEGRFAFDAVLPNTPLVVAAAAPRGLVERLRIELKPGETRDVRLTLQESATVAGKLVHAEDLDPSEYRLQVERPVPGFDPEDRRSWGTWHNAEFDALDGTFRVEGLEPGRLRLVARGPSYGELELDVPRGTTEGLQLVVGGTGSLHGAVVWDDGTTIEAEIGVEVIARHPRAGNRSAARADGVFEIEDVTAGLRHSLVAMCWDADDNFLGNAQPMEVVAPASGLSLRIPRPARIVGRVQRQDGTLAAGATVLGLAGRKLRCDGNGEFRATAPCGVLALSATMEGSFPGAALWLELAPGEERTGIVLELAGAAAVLEVQLLDEQWVPVTWSKLLVTVEGVGVKRVATTSVRTNSKGSFQLTAQRPERVAVSAVLLDARPLDDPIEVQFGPNGELLPPSQNRSAGPVEVDLRAGESSFVQLVL